MILVNILAYLLVGCLLSMLLFATGNMKDECGKGITRYIKLLFIAIVMPVIVPIALITILFKKSKG